MPQFKITLVIEVEADDIGEARCIATEFSERGNDSVDGEVGDVVDQTVELA
jgi:hypothetical protein